MVDPGTLAVIAIATLASAFMAWAIGAGSSGSTPFAPAVGANAISVMTAGFYVGMLGFTGAVLQGANVTEAVGRELILGDPLTAQAAAIALLLAGGLVAIGVFAGYPIATAFTVTGAVVGVGLAMGGDPAWAKYAEIMSMWVLTPFVGGGVAYGLVRLLQSEVRATLTMPALGGLVGAIMVHIELYVLGAGGTGSTIALEVGETLPGPLSVGVLVTTIAAIVIGVGFIYREVSRDTLMAQRRFLLTMGSLVAFSAGGSQVGLAIGPLLPLLDPFEISLWAVLVGGGLGLLIGCWTGAPRMIKAIAQDYASLGPQRSIAALIPSFAIAQTAVMFGLPISFNEIIVSAIVGAGLASGTGGTSREKMFYTVLAWVLSLVLSLGLGYGIYAGLDMTIGLSGA